MPATESETLIRMAENPSSLPSDDFLKLLERFRADLINQAFVILGNQEDAEDVAQETLSKAYLRLHQLRDLSKLDSWLRAINRHFALRLLKRRSFRSEERLGTAQADALEARKETAFSTTAVNNLDYILRVVDNLPQQYREVLVLRFWEKLTNEQIAQRLGVPLGTVCSRMARASQMLVQKVKGTIR